MIREAVIPPAGRRVAITGASGLVGRHVAERARAAGSEVIALGRHGDASFDLADPEHPGLDDALAGVGLLVHSAYAFDARDPGRERRINAEGTADLLRAAGRAGVGEVVVISSMSAHPAVHSHYGATKRAIEAAASAAGARIVRPGLVWDDDAHTGLIAGMRGAVRALPVVPVPRLRSPNQALVHADDLADVVLGTRDGVPGVEQVGHPDLLDLGGIVRRIALRQGRRRIIVPIPAGPLGLALGAADSLGVTLPFRRDNLRGAVDAPPPAGLAQVVAGVALRPFTG